MTTEVNPDLSTRARVRHEPALARYTLWLDERNVGLADYVPTGRAIHFMNTEIDPAHRGEGLEAVLIEHALDDVRQRTTARVGVDRRQCRVPGPADSRSLVLNLVPAAVDLVVTRPRG